MTVNMLVQPRHPNTFARWIEGVYGTSAKNGDQICIPLDQHQKYLDFAGPSPGSKPDDCG